MKCIAQVTGEVMRGSQRGKDLGFPTVNLTIPLTVPEGIYIAETVVDGTVYPSAVFVGAAITFEDHERKLESYILDFDGNLYGKKVTVRLYEKIRDNRKFNSGAELASRIIKDVAAVREFFRVNHP